MSINEFCLRFNDDLLLESKKGYFNNIPYRVDSPNGYPNQQRHVHVLNSKGHEYCAWNADGTRSHSRRWQGEPTAKQKKAAAYVLGISVSILEQKLENTICVEIQETPREVIKRLSGIQS